MCIPPSAAPWSRITIERHGIIIIPRRYYDKVRLKLLYIDDCENGLHEFCDSDHSLVIGVKQWMEFTVCRGATLYTVCRGLYLDAGKKSPVMFCVLWIKWVNWLHILHIHLLVLCGSLVPPPSRCPPRYRSVDFTPVLNAPVASADVHTKSNSYLHCSLVRGQRCLCPLPGELIKSSGTHFITDDLLIDVYYAHTSTYY